ncbi:hypothetical protein ElyMa_005208100 [Elysia marginata]|uniref:Uncharacterized protein n=1 Tax=Elysia marginata TaxID=1093978 RepID=A0AAV4JZA9_9GAST|nr:hypothetical protein ElyMa_005208100 [Elysia marginata]
MKHLATVFLALYLFGVVGGHGIVSRIIGSIRYRPPVPQRPVLHKCNWCAENAVCVDNSYCRCVSLSYTGDPYFLCYRHSVYDMCQLCDDPLLTTENKENTSLTYFSNTLMMDKVVFRSRNQGTCRVRVVVNSFRLAGKSYPRCVLVNINLKNRSGYNTCTFIYKVCGYSQPDGTLRWQIFKGFASKYGRVSLTLWRTISSGSTRDCPYTICGCPTYFHVTKAKILTLRVTCCSLKLGFRPFVKSYEWLKTGVFILTGKTRSHPSSQQPWLLKNFNICLRPGITLRALTTKLGLPDHKDAMSFLALTNMPLDLLALSPEQIGMSNALSKCSTVERQKLFNYADFMFTSHPFIHAVCDRTTGFLEIMKVVKSAADWYCEENVQSCRSIISVINSSAKGLLSRPEKFPKLALFVTNNCTSTAQ